MQTLKKILFAVCLFSGFLFFAYLIQQGAEMQLFLKIIGGVCGAVVVLLMVIYDRDRAYYDFLKLWYEFHVLGKHRNPQPKEYERLMHEQAKLEILEKTDPVGLEKRKVTWKKQLIRAILEASGVYTYKTTGKYGHKARYKFYIDGKKYKVKGK